MCVYLRLFFINLGNKAKIGRVSLDGTNLIVIVDKGVVSSTGIDRVISKSLKSLDLIQWSITLMSQLAYVHFAIFTSAPGFRKQLYLNFENMLYLLN